LKCHVKIFEAQKSELFGGFVFFEFAPVIAEGLKLESTWNMGRRGGGGFSFLTRMRAMHGRGRKQIQNIHAELLGLNRSAANSLKEGLDETLTLQRMGMGQFFGRSFATTNCIESINSGIGKYTGKVTHWMDSNQKYRWTVMACLEMEQRMHKVANYKNLYLLKCALKNEAQNRKESLDPDIISTKIDLSA
jgi:hypothetical protein